MIYLQGDNFVKSGADPSVWFHLVSASDTALTPDVQLSSSAIASVTNQAITVNLPSRIPMGLYALWVRDSTGAFSAPVLINQARATSFEYPEVSPGYTFRIFGRNLFLPSATPSVKFVNGANSYAATVVAAYANDSNVLQVQAPSGLVAGTTYTVTVSNSFGHNATANFDVTVAEKTILGRSGGADPFKLGVPWGPDFTAIAANKIDVTLAPYKADKTGAVNALPAIQQAIAVAKVAPNGGTVYLPAGTYLIDKGTAVTAIDIPAKVVLQGAGIDQTVLNDISAESTGYSHFITIAGATPNSGSLSGVTGFTCNQNMTLTAGGGGPPDIRNYAVNSSEIFFDHIKVNFAHGLFNANKTVIYGSFIPQSSNDTKVLTQNCMMSYLRFGNNNYYVYGYTYGSDYIFRSNSFSQFFARLEFLYINNLLIEGNHFTRDGTFPPPDYGGSTTCGGIEASGANHKILNNTLDAINLPLSSYNDGESILCQNGPIYGGPSGTTTQGSVTSASGHSLTDSTKTWTANQFAGEIVWITSGPGQGAWAAIGSNTATALNLDRSWVTVPTAASKYTILPANSYVLSAATAAAAATLTDTAQSWPTNFHTGDSVAIVNGPGTGQIRSIVSNNLNVLTVSPAWEEIPGSSSKYSINGAFSGGAQRWLVKGNTLRDVPRGIIYYLGGYDCVTVNNRLASAGGIFLSGFQRSFLNSLPYNRFDLGWNNLFADNVVTNPDANASRAGYFASHVGLTATSPLFGTVLLGTEHRRNVLRSSTPNLHDNAFGSDESFANIVIQSTSGNASTGVPAILASIYSDNLSIDSANAYEFTTGCYQTTLWNELALNCASLYSDTKLAGATQASSGTTYGSDPCFLLANFSGAGASTGGSTDLVDAGATASLAAGTGQDSIALSSAVPFANGAGSCVTINTGLTGSGANVVMNPTTARTSWGRIFDGRLVPAPTSGNWQINGGYDFFWRPAQTPTTGNAMRPIDISNNVSGNGLRVTFHNLNASGLVMEIITGANGGGINVSGAYAAGFAANQVYHLGVTFATNVTTNVTTAKIFAVAGSGPIVTSGAGAATPIATGTFTLNPSVVTNIGGVFANDAWTFGNGYYGNGVAHSNDYDCLRFYSVDPGVFAACQVTAPLSTALEYWRLVNFGSTANAGDAADGADPDHDGYSNLVEYALGADPLTAQGSSALLLGKTNDGLHLTLTYQSILDPSLTYSVEASDILTSNTWSAIDTRSGTSAGAVTITDPELIRNHSSRFLRLRVSY